MAKKKKQRSANRGIEPGSLARSSGTTLRTYDVGALPIVNRILERMRLSEIFKQCLPDDDSRTQLPTHRGLLVLLRNILIAREPVYGVGQWASGGVGVVMSPRLRWAGWFRSVRRSRVWWI